MATHLLVGTDSYPLAASGYGKNFCTVSGTSFHLSEQELKEIEAPWWFYVTAAGTITKGVRFDTKAQTNSQGLQRMLADYHQDRLYLYRGVGGSHFSWKDLKSGTLKSEGAHDYPKATMQGSKDESKTCWLPMALTIQDAAGPAAGLNGDEFTKQISLKARAPGTPDDGIFTSPAERDRLNAIPIGIVLRVRVGKNLGIPVAWLDSLETVIKGPLQAQQFTIHRVVWLSANQTTLTSWPAGLKAKYLPPQRPYPPTTKEAIAKWWEECSAWLSNFTVTGDVLATVKPPEESKDDDKKDDGSR